MRILFSAALAGAILLAAPALGGANNMTQPTNNEIAIWAYPAKANYCPNGLQPVVIGGVVCCGTPNQAGYQSNPAPKRAKKHKPSQSYVVYEKGQ